MRGGPGATVLTANNSYSGASMTVSAGTLGAARSVNSAVTVNSGAMLAGTSIVGAITINPGGIFAPGATGTPDT